MKYFVTQISTIAGQTAIGTFEKLTLNEAKAMYYSVLSSFFSRNDLEYYLVQIIDENGDVVLNDHWKYTPQIIAYVPGPEPEENSEGLTTE